jgi:uncharacterized protein (TIRG00374 family)
MKKLYPVILKYVIVFGIIGLLIWLSFRHFTPKNWDDMLGALQRARYLLLLPVFILLMLSHYFRSLRWQQLIEPMGYHPPLFDLLCALLTGYLTNQFLPRGGEVVRCTVITRKHKIPVEKLIGTIITERAVDVLCLLIVGISIFFIQYSLLSAYTHNLLFPPAHTPREQGRHIRWAVVVIAVAVLLAIIITIRILLKKFPTFFKKIFRGFSEGFLSIKKMRSKWKFIAYTALMWTCYIFSTWIGCFAMQETEHLSLATGVVLLFAGTLGIIVTPGGVAAYPIAIQSALLLYDINEDIGLAFGWLLWASQFVFTLVFGTLAYIAINFRKRSYEKHSIRSA